MENVTADDALRVATKYLKPEDVMFLAVGKREEIAPSDPDDRATMGQFFDGEVTHILLRDPLTLK